MIVCYLGLYKEGEIEHISGLTHPCPSTWLTIEGPEVQMHGGFYSKQQKLHKRKLLWFSQIFNELQKFSLLIVLQSKMAIITEAKL